MLLSTGSVVETSTIHISPSVVTAKRTEQNSPAVPPAFAKILSPLGLFRRYVAGTCRM